jgi:hypothetical protein
MNYINPDLLDNASNPGMYEWKEPTYVDDQGKEHPKTSSRDQDFNHRNWVLFDVDPVRRDADGQILKGPDVASNDEEHARAIRVAFHLADVLTRSQNWPAPVITDSGNGAHMEYSIDLPADNASRDLIRAAIRKLRDLCPDPEVKIDLAVSNVGRIWRIQGTFARKGPNTAERPHRMCRILQVPDEMMLLSLEQLQNFAEEESPRAKEHENDHAQRTCPAWVTDDHILTKARNSKAGPKFARLWNGDTSEYDGDDLRADAALCAHLAFWAVKDPERMNSLFRQSKLYRDKWEREDYRGRTIEYAIEHCTNVYQWRKPNPSEPEGSSSPGIIDTEYCSRN